MNRLEHRNLLLAIALGAILIGGMSRAQALSVADVLPAGYVKDGSVFLGEDVTDVSLIGGTILGQNAAWGDGINIRGVHITGQSARIRIRDMAIRDLSSNGIGIFGDQSQTIRDVWIRDVIIEGSDDIVAEGNILRENGSRGATIERGSTRSVFTGNTVVLSGREGLWAPDCAGCVVANNIFDRNGRKPNGPGRYTWNANITINEAHGDPSGSPTADYLVTGNVIYSTKDQIAAIRVDANETTSGIVLRNNLLRGENRTILLEGPRQSEVIASDNEGATIGLVVHFTNDVRVRPHLSYGWEQGLRTVSRGLQFAPAKRQVDHD